jgi:hypothetical protein
MRLFRCLIVSEEEGQSRDNEPDGRVFYQVSPPESNLVGKPYLSNNVADHEEQRYQKRGAQKYSQQLADT